MNFALVILALVFVLLFLQEQRRGDLRSVPLLITYVVAYLVAFYVNLFLEVS